MSVALDRTTRKPTTTPGNAEVAARAVVKPKPKVEPKPVDSVRERAAAAPAADGRSSAGLSGLRGDLALRNQHFAARLATPTPTPTPTAASFAGAKTSVTVVAKKDEGGPLGWIKDRGSDLVDGARNAGSGLVDTAGDLAEEAQARGSDLVDSGRSLVEGTVDRARTQAGRAADRVEGVVEAGVDKVEDGIDAVKDAVADVKDAFSVSGNIDKLGKGDKYKIAVGADVSVEGIKGYAKSNVEVARGADGKYTVSADGELGAGLYGQLGAKLGGNASAEAEALAGVGGKVEMQFDTAEEAKRAADSLLRTGSPAYALVNGGPPSGDDLGFLKDHASAIELRGNAAAKAAAELGVGVRNVANVGLFAGAEVKNEVTLRVDLPRDDKPAAVTYKNELSGKLEAGAQAGLDITKGRPGTGKSGGIGWALQGEVTGKVAVEARIEVPSLDRSALLSDPVGALGQGAKDAFASAKTTTTVGLEGQGVAGKNGGGMEAKLAFEQSPDKLARSGAVERALRGDFVGAVDAAGRTIPVTASLTPFTEHGVSAKPELRVMGFGGGVSLESIRRDYDTPLLAASGTATDARQALTALIAGEAERYAPTPRGFRLGRVALV